MIVDLNSFRKLMILFESDISIVQMVIKIIELQYVSY